MPHSPTAATSTTAVSSVATGPATVRSAARPGPTSATARSTAGAAAEGSLAAGGVADRAQEGVVMVARQRLGGLRVSLPDDVLEERTVLAQ